MSLNDTPTSDRVHIGLFGRRNAGKSSLLNAIIGQNLAVVSDKKGTTTDPVYKTMELLPLGPVVFIDTPGVDDEGTLGELRIKKTKQILKKTDLALLVVDGTKGLQKEDEELLAMFKNMQVSYFIVYNKSDLMNKNQKNTEVEIFVSASLNYGIFDLKEKIAHFTKKEEKEQFLVKDLLHPMDVVVLVIPIDAGAPKGRLILPQQQVIRDVLEAGAICLVTKDVEFEAALTKLKEKPYMVITDSQIFDKVSKQTPQDVYLTSFSILMARKKGFLSTAVSGIQVLETIENHDKILISEGCTHHKQCGDIGSVKLPKWIRHYTKKDLDFDFCSGNEFPEDLSEYRLIIHCGACMLSPREMQNRRKETVAQQIPFTNYGIAIAYMNGILERSIESIPEVSELLKNR